MVKKQLIMEKALELFAENGFEATSVQQITERCGISKGAFYLSFKSKDELIFSLIDHFMSEIIANIEQSVSTNPPVEDLLYNYYFTFFNALQQKADLAKIFMKEQFTSFNVELLERMKIYNTYSNQIILSIVERQFPKVDQQMYGDLAFVIQGFTKHYGELFLFDALPINIQLLCDALVEKTEIIAEHATIPIISREFFTNATCHDVSLTREQLIDMLTQKIEEMEDTIIQESLQLLKQDLLQPTLSTAMIQGLLKNTQDHPHCKWVGYLYEQFLKNNG